MNNNMGKKLDEIRKKYGMKEQLRQSPRKGIYPRQQYQGYYAHGYGQAGPMPMMNPQTPIFVQGHVAMCNPPMGMSSPGPVFYPGQANNTAMGGFRPPCCKCNIVPGKSVYRGSDEEEQTAGGAYGHEHDGGFQHDHPLGGAVAGRKHSAQHSTGCSCAGSENQ